MWRKAASNNTTIAETANSLENEEQTVEKCSLGKAAESLEMINLILWLKWRTGQGHHSTEVKLRLKLRLDSSESLILWFVINLSFEMQEWLTSSIKKYIKSMFWV